MRASARNWLLGLGTLWGLLLAAPPAFGVLVSRLVRGAKEGNDAG